MTLKASLIHSVPHCLETDPLAQGHRETERVKQRVGERQRVRLRERQSKKRVRDRESKRHGER